MPPLTLSILGCAKAGAAQADSATARERARRLRVMARVRNERCTTRMRSRRPRFKRRYTQAGPPCPEHALSRPAARPQPVVLLILDGWGPREDPAAIGSASCRERVCTYW